MTTTTHHGSCHCGAVRFEIDVDLSLVTRCNCTICTKTGTVGALVKPPAFRLVAGADATSAYEWGMKISKRHFCKHCGIQVYVAGHLVELGGDFVGINVNTLDDVELAELPLKYWDGRHNNWDAGMRDAPWPVLRAG